MQPLHDISYSGCHPHDQDTWLVSAAGLVKNFKSVGLNRQTRAVASVGSDGHGKLTMPIGSPYATTDSAGVLRRRNS